MRRVWQAVAVEALILGAFCLGLVIGATLAAWT
jgi:hypothetical protein